MSKVNTGEQLRKVFFDNCKNKKNDIEIFWDDITPIHQHILGEYVELR